MRVATALLVALSLAATPLNAQTPEPARAFLLVVDDLHLDFRETPRTRWMMQQLLARAPRPGDLWFVSTTGRSSVSLAPTTDLTAVRAAIDRVIGNVVRDRQAPARETPAASENHVDFATVTAIQALDELASRPGHGEIVVLFIVQAPGTGDASPPSQLTSAAARAGARSVVFSLDELLGELSAATVSPKETLDAMFARLALP